MQMHASPRTNAGETRHFLFTVHAFWNLLARTKQADREREREEWKKETKKKTARNQEKIEIDMEHSVKYSGNMHRPI